MSLEHEVNLIRKSASSRLLHVAPMHQPVSGALQLAGKPLSDRTPEKPPSSLSRTWSASARSSETRYLLFFHSSGSYLRMKVFKGFRLNCFITFLNSIFTPLSLLQEDDDETEEETEEEGERGEGSARGAKREVAVGAYSSDGEEMFIFLFYISSLIISNFVS